MLYGFGAYSRLDRNWKGGGVVLYITEDISSRLLSNKSKTGTETISVEINLRKRKWFLNFLNLNGFITSKKILF